MEKIIAKIPDIFHPATPAVNSCQDLVTETPSSSAVSSSPKPSPARNLRQEMSPAIGTEGRRAASATSESSEARGPLASVDGFERHVEKAEQIQSSVSALKIKRRRLLEQVEHIRGLEQTRKEAEKAVSNSKATHEQSLSDLVEANRVLAAAEARVMEAMKKEREDREEAEVAALRAKQAANEAKQARSVMEADKKDFEEILGRLRRNVQPVSQEEGA